MAPKTVPTNPTKLASVLNYFHTSGVAHSIKDLEKALPSLASINSMHVKDYLAALTDENKVRVEKIGSGNWYWAFAGEEKRKVEGERDRALREKEEAEADVQILTKRVEEGEAIREEEEGQEKLGLVGRKEALGGEVETLQKELERYRDSDPVELERKAKDVEELKALVEKWTEHVLSIESYLKNAFGMDKEQLGVLKRQTYGNEYDEEEGGLREL